MMNRASDRIHKLSFSRALKEQAGASPWAWRMWQTPRENIPRCPRWVLYMLWKRDVTVACEGRGE